jgi:hypothetical protein
MSPETSLCIMLEALNSALDTLSPIWGRPRETITLAEAIKFYSELQANGDFQ